MESLLPGSSAATPIIFNNYVFVSSILEIKETKNKGRCLLAMCFDRTTGDLLWWKGAVTVRAEGRHRLPA